tara:strand:+ start:3154 stop:4629 length:1476 start_codon:yes stop_codon:yes gene_type:complete
MAIKIYQKEIDDGIGDLVKSTASVAYCSEATLHKGGLESAKEVISDKDILDKVLAENKDQIDLYYLESVLVSTGWNKNDDVFLAKATWNARNTPEDKQFNFMHDENDIIGHITGSYVLTKDGKAVADDDTEGPDEFDIITQAVLYNSWTNDDNRERMAKIIAEIEEGKWYVSMECLFAGFDYALTDEDGHAKILARDEQSAFLTKHLRAYGGKGEYEGYKVGRALRNISFSGKGLVAKPANPRSIILKSVAFDIDHNSNFNIGEFTMADNVLEKQLEEVRAELAASKAENEAIKAQIEEAKDAEFASKVEAFESTINDKDSSIAELEESIKSTQARVAELEDALAKSQEELTVAMKDMEDMKMKEKMEKRKAALVEAGISEEDVEDSLASFDALDDEAFDSVVALMAPSKKPKAKDDKENPFDKKKKDKDEEVKAEEEVEVDEEEAEAEITQEAFEEVETSEATLVEAEVDEMEATRASVASWLENNVLNK